MGPIITKLLQLRLIFFPLPVHSGSHEQWSLEHIQDPSSLEALHRKNALESCFRAIFAHCVRLKIFLCLPCAFFSSWDPWDTRGSICRNKPYSDGLCCD